jgi:hypothetical protein
MLCRVGGATVGRRDAIAVRETMVPDTLRHNVLVTIFGFGGSRTQNLSKK